MSAASLAGSHARRSMRRVTDRAAMRVLINAQMRANEIVRLAADDAESMRQDARAYVRAICYEAAVLREEAAALFDEAARAKQESSDSKVSPTVIRSRTEIDLDEQFDRYIDLDMGDDPAKDWMLGSRG